LDERLKKEFANLLRFFQDMHSLAITRDVRACSARLAALRILRWASLLHLCSIQPNMHSRPDEHFWAV